MARPDDESATTRFLGLNFAIKLRDVGDVSLRHAEQVSELLLGEVDGDGVVLRISSAILALVHFDTLARASDFMLTVSTAAFKTTMVLSSSVFWPGIYCPKRCRALPSPVKMNHFASLATHSRCGLVHATAASASLCLCQANAASCVIILRLPSNMQRGPFPAFSSS